MGLSACVRRLGWANLLANIGLVVTGGAVRLTGSGLGCPTWPRCTEDSFVPRGALGVHGAIEFGNRMLILALVAIATAAFVAARRSGRQDLWRRALVIGLSVPAQALIGGLSVLTGLNPWVVALHLLCSLAIIGVAVSFLHRIDRPFRTSAGGWLLPLAVLAGTWAVFVAGAVVTGAGPHAGDADAPRNGLDPAVLSRLHSLLVVALIALTVALLVSVRDDRRERTAVLIVLGVQLGQGLIGFAQYATGLPEVLVGMHLLAAAVLSAVTTHAVLTATESRAGRPSPRTRERRPIQTPVGE
jgi:heme a synthase